MSRKKILFIVLFISALLLFTTSRLMINRQNNLLESSIRSIEDANSVIIKIKVLSADLNFLESTIYKYIISGNENYLSTYNKKLPEVESKLIDLKKNTLSHEQLSVEINRFITTAGNNLKAIGNIKQSAFNSTFKAESPDTLSVVNIARDQLQAQSELLTNVIINELNKKELERKNYSFQRRMISISGLILGLFFIILLFYLLQREMKNTRFVTDKLRNREEQLTVTLTSIGEAVITTDQLSAITFMNPAAEKLTGWRQEDAISKPVKEVFDVIDEETRKPIVNIVSKVLADGLPVEIQNHTILRSKDSREIVINNSGSPLKNNDGVIIGSVLVFHDVTERKKSEIKLQRSESRFNKAFFSSPAPMMISRLKDGMILEVNKSFESLLQYSREELLGNTSFGMGIYADQLQRIKAALKVKSQGYLHNEEIKFKSKFGDTKDLLISLETIELENEPCLLSILIDITEWKKSEAALIATERKYRSIFENTAEGIYQSTPDGKFIIVNPSMARIFGYESPAEMVQLVTDISTQIYADPDDRKHMADIIKDQGNVYGYELKAITKSKNLIWIRANIRTVTDDAGNILYYEGTLEDITKHKIAENALRRSEEKFSSMVHNISDIITLLDEKGNITYVSSSVFQVLGFNEKDVVGRNIFEFIHPDDQQYISNELGRIINNDDTVEIVELRFLNSTGNYIILEAKGNNQLVNPSIRSIIVNARDITKRKQIDEQLRLNKRAIESTIEGILITDAKSNDNEIVFVNEGFKLITGYEAEEVIGRNCRFLQGSETDKLIITSIKASLKANDSFAGEVLNYKKDGTPFWNFLRISPIFDEKGVVTHYVGFQNDITERKLAAQQIEIQNREILKTNAELDRFVYSTSHDLRAPLTSVLGLIGFIEDETNEPDTLEHARMIRERIKQLDDFIQNILDYSRNNRLNVSSNLINFDDIIQQTISGLQHIKQASNTNFKVDIENNAEFYSDKARITTIFENLIGNSIKFYNPSQTNPFIFIQVKVNRDEVLLVVEDNGIGIEMEHQDKIFNMFYRISSAAPGSGLGLYLVKEIIDKLGGGIKVQSSAGIGTKFIISLRNERID